MAARKKAHGHCRSHRSSWLWDCCNWLICGECLPKGRQIKSERHSHNLSFAVHAYKSYVWYRINQNYAWVRKKTAREDIFFSRTTTLYTQRQECCACKQYNCQNQNPDLNNPWQDRLECNIQGQSGLETFFVMYGIVLMKNWTAITWKVKATLVFLP